MLNNSLCETSAQSTSGGKDYLNSKVQIDNFLESPNKLSPIDFESYNQLEYPIRTPSSSSVSSRFSQEVSGENKLNKSVERLL
jgi:hypothetical protein